MEEDWPEEVRWTSARILRTCAKSPPAKLGMKADIVGKVEIVRWSGFGW